LVDLQQLSELLLVAVLRGVQLADLGRGVPAGQGRSLVAGQVEVQADQLGPVRVDDAAGRVPDLHADDVTAQDAVTYDVVQRVPRRPR
jgi:hypothetical protein